MRVEVRALIVRDGKVVVNEERRHGRPRLSLPGGRVERWESTEQALIREVHEELGIDVTCGAFVCAFEVVQRFKIQDLNLVFAADLTHPDDVSTLRLVDPKDPDEQVFPPVLSSIWDAPTNANGHWLGNIWRHDLRPPD